MDESSTNPTSIDNTVQPGDTAALAYARVALRVLGIATLVITTYLASAGATKSPDTAVTMPGPCTRGGDATPQNLTVSHV